MFRSAKARRKKQHVRSSLTTEDEEGDLQSNSAAEREDSEESNVLLSLQSKRRDLSKKKKSLRTTTFGGASSINRTTNIVKGGSSASKKRRRIGFGGISSTDEPNDPETDGGGATTQVYDSESLAQLKAEQEEMNSKVSQRQRKQDVEKTSSSIPQHLHEADNISRAIPRQSSNQQHGATKTEGEEDFISLNTARRYENDRSSDSGIVLVGDEAMEAALNVDSHQVLSGSDNDDKYQRHENVTSEKELGDESSMWEAQVAERAGVDILSRDPPSSQTRHRSEQKFHNIVSLTEIRQQFVDAQSILRQQMEDSKTSYERRQVDIDHAGKEELERHTSAVQSCGKALEFYQGWRGRVVPFVAALRELSDKLFSIQNGLVQLVERQTILVKERRQWQIDDMLAELHQMGELEAVLGRQPASTLLVDETNCEDTFDEFGRTVQSQRVLQREKRRQQLLSIRTTSVEHSMDGVDSEFALWMMKSEITSFHDQSSALHEAFQFALLQVQEEFTILDGLTKLFYEWFSHNSNEYKDCFAGLCLADLASVLVRAEICSRLLNRTNNRHDSLRWVRTIQNAVNSGLLEDAAIVRLMEKAVFPIFNDFFQTNRYDTDLHSQTQTLLKIWKEIPWLSGREATIDAVETWKSEIAAPSLLETWEMEVKELAFPVLAEGSDNSNLEKVEGVKDQLIRGLRCLENVVEWTPYLPTDKFAECFINFLVSTVLPFISSLNAAREQNKHNGLSGSEWASSSFANIYKLLQKTTWLNRPDLLVQVTTLQAASEID